jgi:protein involved in polysaccharide export with SLBB domain
MKVFVLLLSVVLGLIAIDSSHASGQAEPHEGYRLGPNDIVRIQVFGEEDLTLETKVEGDGQITYPLLGILHVGGLTIHELQQDLTTRLAAGYLSKPKVTVTVARHRNFYVGGEVKTPGGYPYEEGLTVQKAITLAGGFTEKSDKRVITVTRAHGSQVEILTLEPDAMVRPDDLVAVAQAKKFYVSGEVKTPGGYPYEGGLTAQKAITLAGGFTEKADKRVITVTRAHGSQVEILTLEPDAMVRPDDLVAVAQARKFYVNGEVRRAGDYPYERELTLHKAITMAGGFTDKASTTRAKVIRKIGGEEQEILLGLEELILPEDIIVVPRSFF